MHINTMISAVGMPFVRACAGVSVALTVTHCGNSLTNCEQKNALTALPAMRQQIYDFGLTPQYSRSGEICAATARPPKLITAQSTGNESPDDTVALQPDVTSATELMNSFNPSFGTR